jgi:hypothetical protein
MKTRTALALLYAMSFLMVCATSGSARISAWPYDIRVSLDSQFVTFDLRDSVITPDTIRGSIQNLTDPGFGPVTLKVKITSALQWVTFARIGGNQVQDGDNIVLGDSQTLPIEIIVFPYAERADTESYCLSLLIGSSTLSEHCKTFVVTNNTAGVSIGLPVPNLTLVPNPAGSYMFVRGLSGVQAEYRYEIFSASGAEVRKGILPDDARIGLQGLPSGAYRLLLSDAKRTLSNTAFTVLH